MTDIAAVAQLAEGPCPKCDDSGWIEHTSGGFWTGENMQSHLEICDCICGQDVLRERQSLVRAHLAGEGE